MTLLQKSFTVLPISTILPLITLCWYCEGRLVKSTEDVNNFEEVLQPDNNTKQMTNEEKMSISDQSDKFEPDTDLLTEDTDVEEGFESDTWMMEALLDVAYYLRAHKFNDFDRRYIREENVQEDDKYFYAAFPEPPLRHFHWEVYKYCSQNFSSCLKYLHRTILDTNLQRTSDTSVLVNSQGWNWTEHEETIRIVDEECKRLKDIDRKTAEPFQGPLERFQWRTSASYFMCMFALQNTSTLILFGERCDNFANCLDEQFGSSNKDPRADDSKPFACALYSFCPDPCCPRKHVTSINQCRLADEYPCWNSSEVMTSRCTFEMEQNQDLASIIYNRWNVTCTCKDSGFVWDSRFGICVDRNECLEGNHKCDESSQLCFNTVGGHECCCKWGYEYDTRTEHCVPSQTLMKIIDSLKNVVNKRPVEKEKSKTEPQSVLVLVLSVIKYIKYLFS